MPHFTMVVEALKQQGQQRKRCLFSSDIDICSSLYVPSYSGRAFTVAVLQQSWNQSGRLAVMMILKWLASSTYLQSMPCVKACVRQHLEQNTTFRCSTREVVFVQSHQGSKQCCDNRVCISQSPGPNVWLFMCTAKLMP